MKRYALIVAAGSGKRLGASVPKALVRVCGTPIVAHAASSVACVPGVSGTVVVTTPGQDDAFASALATVGANTSCVPGGPSRQASVLAGLRVLAADHERSAPKGATPNNKAAVIVHDAARCLTPPAVFERVFAAIEAGARACIPVVPVSDSLRHVNGLPVDRASMRAVQTPQGFDLAGLLDAHLGHAARGADETQAATDDASLMDVTPVFVEGDPHAFKITTPLDLALAEAVLNAGHPAYV